MIENIFLILIFAALYGITMKIADLLDEHGLKWFKGSATIFGILWGLFGALLVASNIQVANVLLAMILAFIFRMRIDYRNHAIATIIIIASFLLYSTFEPLTFFIFLANFVIFGSLKDVMDDVYKRRDWLQKLTESGWYYVVPAFVYAILTNQWIVFYTFTTYIIFYDLVKYIEENNRTASPRP